MRIRATLLFSLPACAATVLCGCNAESPYNIPADPTKEAAQIRSAAPPKKVAAGRRKVTKPPGGGPLRDPKSMQPSG